MAEEYEKTPESIINKMPSVIKKFKNIIKSNDPVLIAKYIEYPYSLGKGIEKIQNEEEFIENYDIILPIEIQNYLLSSPIENWGLAHQSNGYCLDFCPGANITIDGKIRSLKKSDKLKEYRENLIDIERKKIHPSVQNYKYNEFILDTDEYIVRIDDMTGIYPITTEIDKTKIYRLSAWKKNKSFSEQPDIIIDKGYMETDIEFKYSSIYYIFNNHEYHVIFEHDRYSPIDNYPYKITFYKNMFYQKPKILRQNSL